MPTLNLKQAKRLAPEPRTDGLKSVAAYSGHQMDDGRRAVMTVRGLDTGQVREHTRGLLAG